MGTTLRVKKAGDTKVRNRTVVFCAVLDHMPDGIGRNALVRFTRLKAEVVDRNLSKLAKVGFLVRLNRGRARTSPFLIHPNLFNLSDDEFERICLDAGLFQSKHGYVFLGDEDSPKGRKYDNSMLPTIGSSYDTMKRMIRFMNDFPGTQGSPNPGSQRSYRSQNSVASGGREETPEPATRFSPKATIQSISNKSNKSLMFFQRFWLSSLLRREPMDVFALAKNAPLGGKPLNHYAMVAVVESMRNAGLGYPDEDGRWHLTNKGLREIPDFS